MSRLLRSFALTTAVLAAGLSQSGCHDVTASAETDTRYIHQPDDTTFPTTDQEKGNLLPTTAGSRGKVRVMARSLADIAAAVGDPNGIDANSTQVVTANVVASPDRSHSGSGSFVQLSLMPQGQTKPLRVQSYKSDAQGISLATIQGVGPPLSLTPPMPLIQYPIKEGAVLPWQGIAHVGKESMAVKGYSRLSYWEKLDLPKGKVGAYRVDSVLIVPQQGRLTSIPMNRWFAPGLGVVKERFYGDNSEITVEGMGS